MQICQTQSLVLIPWPDPRRGYSVHGCRLCSGLSKDATQLCVNWMAPFVETVGWFGRATPREFAKVETEDKHSIQTHTDYVTMLVSMFLFYLSRMVN